MKKRFQKALGITLSILMIAMIVLPVVKIAKAASATIQFQGCGASQTEPCFWIPPNGGVLPASSQPAPLFSFHLKKASGSTTLTNVKVNLVDGSTAGTVAATDITSLAVYKRTSWSGEYTFPSADKIGELTTINAFSSKASNNNIIDITQDGTKNAIGSDFYSAEYLVTVKSSASWSDTDQLRYSLSADWVTVSDGTLGAAYTYPAELNDWYYATAPAGFMGMMFGVENVSFISGTEVDVRFTADVETVSAGNVLNYKIGTTNPASVSILDPKMARLTFSGLTITPNQTQLNIYGPSGASGGVKDQTGNAIPGDIVMMIMGGSGGGGGMPIVVSEVMIGQGGDGLKEFVEVYNTSPGTLDLAAMNIKLWSVYLNGSVLTHQKILNLSGNLPGFSYILIASTQNGGAPDLNYDATTGSATEGMLRPNSGVYLSTSDTSNMAVFDRLGWGASLGEMSDGMAKCSSSDTDSCTVANDGKSLERKSNPSSTSTTMNTGGADVGNGNSYASHNNQYDFIQRTAANPQNAASSPETPGGAGFGASNTPPQIFHEPLFMGITGSDLMIVSEIVDDSGEVSASNAKLFYRAHDDNGAATGATAGAWNSISGVKTATGSSFFKFTIPSSFLDADKDVDYFLRAYDATNYSCMPGSCTAEGNLNSSTIPFYVNLSASAGSGVISGYVKDSAGNGISDSLVYLEGMPFVSTTNSSGSFTISGLPEGVYQVKAKGGSYAVNGTTANYTDGWLDGIYINATNPISSNNLITLLQGYSGLGGDKESPRVMWTAPGDMMQGFPIDRPLFAVFNKAMNTSSITGGSATTDNIALLNDSGAIVAGTVAYYPDSLGRPAGLPPDSYLMIYTPSSALTKGKTYTLVLRDTLTDSAGNRLMGNRASGGHSVTFTTFFDTTGGTFGQGANFPPYIKALSPNGGSFDVSVNTKVNITFSEPMNQSTVNTTNIKLYKVTNPFSATESLTQFTNYTVSMDSSGQVAILTLTSNLQTSSHYRIKILSGVTSAKGITMSQAAGAEMFVSDFDTSSSSGGDVAAPTVKGSYPKDGDTGVISNIPSIDIGFSENMDITTINTNTVMLKRGTSSVSATIEYDIGERAAHLLPVSGLVPGASYTITVTSGSSGVKDAAGNQIAADYTAAFTVSTAIDSIAPTLEFVNCDDFSCAVTFSEPMNNAKPGETDFTSGYSALVKGNYTIKAGPVGTSDWNAGAGVHNIDLANVITEYDQMNNTVVLKGAVGLSSGEDFRITVSNVKDKTGNPISASNFVGPVKSSIDTGGMMGPGGSNLMGPPTVGGSSTSAGGSGGFDYGSQWEKPKNVMPMNMTAGKTTKYIVEFPITSAVPAGGSIKLTFPTGSDIVGAKLVSESESMMNKDINGPATGIVKIGGVDSSGGANNDGVSVNTTSRAITITIDAANAAANANDMLRFDIEGIKNPAVPKSFDTSGYAVDIKTFDVAGKLLESLTSFPFFINETGNYGLSGTITATGATDGSTMKVLLDSWKTGPMETTITFASNSASYSFTGLTEGDYNLFTEPSVSLGTDYIGYMKPDPIFISSAICTVSSTCTKNITLVAANSGVALTVYIVGDFSAATATDRNIDIFAGGPEGNTVKTVTLLAQNYTSGSPYTATLYLPSLDGSTADIDQWWVGMGPSMPKANYSMGPPPMPSWMPPAHIELTLTGDAGSPTWVEKSSGTVAGNANNDGKLVFNITSASNQIIGYVVDGSGNGVANVDVEAHRTMGGFGMPSHSQTDNNGKFTLKVTTGIYEVNAWMPGLPPSPGKIVDVRANTAGADDGNATADVYKDNGTTLVVDKVANYNPATSSEKDLVLKISKTSITISGKLLDNDGNPVGYAPVWAYNTANGESRPSGTDSSGNYTIYASEGNWNVEAFIPGTGDVSYANNPVAITSSSKSDINIRPASSVSFSTISGTITIGGAVVTNANIWVDRGTYHNGTNTNSLGKYQLKVPANTGYILHVWTPEYGELEPVTVNASSDVTQNLTLAAESLATLTLNFTNYSGLNSSTEAFVGTFNPTTRKGNNQRIDDISSTASTTLKIPTGNGYEFHLFIPGMGEVSPTCENVVGAACADNASTPDTWNLTADATITFVIPNTASLYTFQITINDGSGNPLDGAFAWMGNKTGGFNNGQPVNSLGVAALKVPAGTYKLGADKSGYTAGAPLDIIAGGASDNLATACTTYTAETKTCAKTIALTTNPYTISGQVKTSLGAGVAGAWVWADKVTSATDLSFSGGWTGDEADSNGNFSLSVSDGYWVIHAVADGYSETVYVVSGSKAAVQVNSASVTGKDIVMVANSGFSAVKPKSTPITPASGGTIDDTNNTGVKLVVPPSALGSDTSSSTINIKDTYSAPKTDAVVPLGGKGKNISATNSSGQAVTTLQGSINLEMTYDPNDLPTGVSESELILVYFDDATGEWVEVAANQDATNNSFSGTTDHFTTYAIAYSADTTGPTTPSSPTLSSKTSSTVNFTWTASTDSETSVAGYEVLRSSDGANFTTIGSTDPWSTGSFTTSVLDTDRSYSDTGRSAGTTYYYQVVAYDTAGNHSASSSSFQVTTSSASGGGSSGSVVIPPQTPTEETNQQQTADQQNQQQTNQQTGNQQSQQESAVVPITFEASAYDYEYVSQSAYPRVSPGMTATLKLTLKNTGTATWYKNGDNPLRLGIKEDKVSQFINSNRVSMDQLSVASGEDGTFTFIVTAPPTTGEYKEYFQPVVDGLTWLDDIGIYWEIRVDENSYHAEYVGQSSYLTIGKNSAANLWVEYKNTGTATWNKEGLSPIHLGTSSPQDRASPLRDSSWLSENRAAKMNKESVLSGEIARFGFTIQAPGTSGAYREYFRPVVEGLEWMEDAGLYWDVAVVD